MAKKKTHQAVDGRLLQMNKRMTGLKMKQREKIAGWLYEEYKKYVLEQGGVPDKKADNEIIDTVLEKIEVAGIWIPDGEIVKYYYSKKQKWQTRMMNEKKQRFNDYVAFYKSIIDQDRCSVVICNLEHEIIYMNPAAVSNYAKHGGDELVGQCIMDCHMPETCQKMQQVVDWFAESPEHNIVYTFHNEKQNKDVYMVALRDDEKLIGYYEKHEFRDKETMKMYDLWER